MERIAVIFRPSLPLLAVDKAVAEQEAVDREMGCRAAWWQRCLIQQLVDAEILGARTVGMSELRSRIQGGGPTEFRYETRGESQSRLCVFLDGTSIPTEMNYQAAC